MNQKSFSHRLKEGWTNEQLMEYYGLTEKQYDKIIASLESIKNRSK